jgi:hypothetical protein
MTGVQVNVTGDMSIGRKTRTALLISNGTLNVGGLLTVSNSTKPSAVYLRVGQGMSLSTNVLIKQAALSIYGPVTTKARGGIVTMNFYDADGHLLDYRRVEELASEERISLRTGCFCNPGTGEVAEGLTTEDISAAVEDNADMTLPRFLQFITHRGGKSAGAIRVSLGVVSNFADVHRFVRFVAGLRDQTRLTIGEATFDIESCRVIRNPQLTAACRSTRQLRACHAALCFAEPGPLRSTRRPLPGGGLRLSAACGARRR